MLIPQYLKKLILGLSLSAAFCTLGMADNPKSPESFTVTKNSFLLNDKPFVVKAAELHYPRIPKEYWDHRIKMCKALGMNTICLYVFWNTHEPHPGVFDFSGQQDLRKFVELCAENDMHVILRPGPYVCAEWEMGGLPWWLLQKKDIRLRENDPYFLERVAIFENEVAKQVSDLTVENGGPILMVQVENEYGSYGKDKEYVSAIRDMLRSHYGNTQLFQCDWSSNFLDNGLDDLLWTLNFGSWADVETEFAPLRAARPETPLMCSEFWSGWFDKWGEPHETRSAEKMVSSIDEMLSKNISFSLYMTHGGTNWGHWAGANSPGYIPFVASYDYDAPVSESGRTTPKYHLLRATLGKYADSALPAIPDSVPTITIPEFTMTRIAPILSNLPEPLPTDTLITMESAGQGYGSILYSTILDANPGASQLTADGVHDFAVVYLNGEFIGTIDRRKAENQLTLPGHDREARLDIFVEATGRINFGREINDFKGITGSVSISNGNSEIIPDKWEIRLFPDTPDFYDSLQYTDIPVQPDTKLAAGAYRGSFNLENTGDTFLDFSSWGKGLVYVNGHPLGRIWNIGPQQTLYAPGCWLRQGENEIIVFDILGPDSPVVRGEKEPILDSLKQ